MINLSFFRFIIFGLLFSGCSSFVDNETIKFGFIGPLTGGSMASGVGVLNMVNLSINEINLNGGILGKQVELIIKDGKCTKIGGVNAARELVDMGIKVIIGGACSSETLGAMTITEGNEVILISSFSTSSTISELGDFTFRNIPSTDYGFKILADMVYELGYRNVAVFTEVTSFTNSQRKTFMRRFEQLGGEVVLSESFSFENTNVEIKDNFERINEFKNIDLVLLLGQTYDSYINFRNAMIYYGVEDYQLLSGEMMWSNDILNDEFNFFDGTFFSDIYVDFDSLEFNFLLDKIDQNYDLDSFFDTFPYWTAATSYDLPYLLQDVIEKCNMYETYCIRDKLYKVRNFDGILNLEKIDENGDGVLKQAIYVVENSSVRRFD
jgi:branched-chain amino acid transport system substrate-binding protein